MEPFGILQFLQSLLPANPSQPPVSAQNSEHEKTPDEPASTPLTAEKSDAQDAIARFMESHEKRASRLRKR